MADKTHKMTEDDLLALTGNEIRQSVGYRTGKLSEARRKALQYYLARPVGDLAPSEIEGRSTFVSTDVADTIEGMMPFLMRVFSGNDQVVEFVPQKAGDERAAQMATDYLSYLFHRKNHGYKILETWFRDALVSKLGVLKVWWHADMTEAKEDYEGLTDGELAQLTQDPEIEVLTHTGYDDPVAAKQKADALKALKAQLQQLMSQPPAPPPSPQPPQQGQPPQGQQPGPQQPQQGPQQAQPPQPPAPPPPSPLQALQAQIQTVQGAPVPQLHDVTCKRRTDVSRVMIENVPPEEFLFARETKSIDTARFLCHQRLWTLSDLRAAGYKNVDDLQSDDTMTAFSPERVERNSINDEQGWMVGIQNQPGDDSQRQIWVSECYLKVDFDGDGISEWRKVTRAGNTILDNEECDGPPFVTLCPIPLPHQLVGQSIADVTMETQRSRTQVVRAIQDNLAIGVNGRFYAVEGQVNLDDLLTSRPGGVVRIKQPGAVGRLEQGMADAAGAYQMLEYFDQVREQRTGFTRYSQGQDADSLNQTATGVDIITTRADERMEMLARQFAETGVRDLFLLMLKLVCQHQDKVSVISVAGQWVDINPREWRNQFDLEINVGLGSGNKDAQISRMNALMQQQMAMQPLGLIQPQNLYASAQRFTSLLGLKSPERYWTDPGQNPPPQQPSPDQIKVQGQMQIEQAKAQAQAQIEAQKLQQEQQLDAVRRQHEAQLEQARMQMQAQVDQNRQEWEARQKMAEAQQQAQLAAMKAERDAAREESDRQFNEWKARLDAETKIVVAKIGKLGEMDAQEPGEQNFSQILADIGTRFTSALEQMQRPKQIVRGPDGRVSGIV